MNERASNFKTRFVDFKGFNARNPSALATWLTLAAISVLPLPQNGRLMNWPSWCPFFNLTQLPCPLCGMTRSLACCAHGAWSQAWHYHLLGPPLFALLILSSTRFLARAVTRRNVTHRNATQRAEKPHVVFALPFLGPRFAHRQSIAWTIFGLSMVAWLVRLAGWWPLPI